MQAKRLRGLKVIKPEEARHIGVVSDFLVDPVGGRVAALMVRPADLDMVQRIPAERVGFVGQHAVVLKPEVEVDLVPRLPSHDRLMDGRTLKGVTVFSDDGRQIGRIAGAQVDQTTLAIEAFELSGGFLRYFRRDRGRIDPTRLVACSKDLMLIRASATAKAALSPAVPDAIPTMETETRTPASAYELAGSTNGERGGPGSLAA